jgi:hypothetical protein
MRAELQTGVSRIFVCGRRGEIILPLWNTWIVAGNAHCLSERDLHSNFVNQGNGHNQSLDVVKPVSTPAMNPQLQIDFGRRTQLHGARHPAQMTYPAKEKIIVALDTPDSISALSHPEYRRRNRKHPVGFEMKIAFRGASCLPLNPENS